MKNLKKRLSIEIEEIKEDEEEIQLNQVINESEKINMLETIEYCQGGIKAIEDERRRIAELNNLYINQIGYFMENENQPADLSFNWLPRLHNLNLLSKSIHITSEKVAERVLTKRDFATEFKLIKLITEDTKHKENQIKIGRNLIRSNRYSDMLPYQHNTALIGEEGSQMSKSLQPEFKDSEAYINASYIDGPLPEDNRYFIATQGPLNNTIAKFWKLVFSKNVKLIIMLCNLEEEGRKKCESYWPSTPGVVKQVEDVEIYMEKEEWLKSKCLLRREFAIRISGVERKVTQLQVANWSDHRAPEEDTGYSTVEWVLNTISDYKAAFPMSPVLTHCSAGTGRTGALIAIYNIIRALNIIRFISNQCNDSYKVKPFFSVFNIVRKLREQRMGMVSSFTQYKYIYEFCFEWLSKNFSGESSCVEDS